MGCQTAANDRLDLYHADCGYCISMPTEDTTLLSVSLWMVYCIAGKFGGDNVWRIDSYKLFGEEKFGEWLDQPKNTIV